MATTTETTRVSITNVLDNDDSYKIEKGAISNCPVWESHKRGKNWFAVIQIDPKSPGGVARNFQERAKGDFLYIIDTKQLKPGQAIEFGADYYSGSGKKCSSRYYGIIVELNDKWITFRKTVSAREAVELSEEFLAQLETERKQAAQQQQQQQQEQAQEQEQEQEQQSLAERRYELLEKQLKTKLDIQNLQIYLKSVEEEIEKIDQEIKNGKIKTI